MTSAGIVPRRLITLLVVAVTVFAPLFSLGAPPARATTYDISAPLAQVSPYQPPEVTDGGFSSWLGPFAPIGRLPLWAQAAIFSAGAAIAFILLQAAVRWMWRFVSDRVFRGPA
jgi:hypothetical protein